jgi:hypothetical protein
MMDKELEAAMDVVRRFGFVCLPREGVKKIEATEAVSYDWLARMKSDSERDNFAKHVRANLARAMAHEIMTDASLFCVKSETKKGDSGAVIRYSAHLSMFDPRAETDWVLDRLRGRA